MAKCEVQCKFKDFPGACNLENFDTSVFEIGFKSEFDKNNSLAGLSILLLLQLLHCIVQQAT